MGNQLRWLQAMGAGKAVGILYSIPARCWQTQLDVYGDIVLGVGGAVVALLLKCIPSQQDNGSIYHVIMDYFYTSPGLLCHLQKQSIAATGIVRLGRMGNSPLKSVKEVEKSQRGTCTSFVAMKTSSSFSAIR